MSAGSSNAPRPRSESQKSQSERDSLEASIPLLNGVRFTFPDSVPSLPKGGCAPPRGQTKLAVPQRTGRVPPRRLDDRSRVHRARKTTTFPARGRLFPAIQFADVPSAPQGYRWAFPANSISMFSLDWAKEDYKESSPDETSAAREGTARIARALYRGDVIPGWSFGRGDCQITWGGQAVSVLGQGRVQMLEGPSITALAWIPWKNKLPQSAFKVGRTYDGEDLYIGRSCIRGRTLFGRFQESYGVLLVNSGGSELVCGANFEILADKHT